VNGSWPDQPSHIRAFLNPCLTSDELTEGRALAASKPFGYPFRLLFVGRLEEPKGVSRALEILARLDAKGFSVALDFVGDGPARVELERTVIARGLQRQVTFHGWQPRSAISRLYATAHLLLFPSSASEGWPKVLSEAMGYGAIPVASRISSIPEYLLRFDIGTVADPDDIDGFVNGVIEYLRAPERWQSESARAVVAAAEFSYAEHVRRVSLMLGLDGTLPPREA
jgi:glycosyltransferase involved in cell wall biosynthesis